MENKDFIKLNNYIKQLEKENLLLKRQFLENIHFENTQIIQLKFIIETQEKQINDLKRKYAKLQLGIA